MEEMSIYPPWFIPDHCNDSQFPQCVCVLRQWVPTLLAIREGEPFISRLDTVHFKMK